jgi:hypothetical protein
MDLIALLLSYAECAKYGMVELSSLDIAVPAPGSRKKNVPGPLG